MATITNNSNGPRSIHTNMGVVTLQKGESLPEGHTVSDADMKAMNAVDLLGTAKDGDQQAGTNSIADIQREIASNATPAILSGGGSGDGGDGGVTDAQVKELADSMSGDDLRKLADDEGAASDGATKADVARAILEKRAAA